MALKRKEQKEYILKNPSHEPRISSKSSMFQSKTWLSNNVVRKVFTFILQTQARPMYDIRTEKTTEREEMESHCCP